MFEQFPLSALDNAKENLTKLIDNNKAEIEKLLEIENKTYINFMRPLMELSENISIFFTPISHLNSVADSKQSRDAFSSCLPILSEYSTMLSQHEGLYNAISNIANEHGLNTAQKSVIKHSLTSFKLGGIGLDEYKKNRVKTINKTLSELSDNFGKNVLDATNAFDLTLDNDDSIKDMPESDKQAAKVENGYKFTLQAPSYIAFMTYCSDRNLREKMYKAYMTRAPQNSDIIEQILKLRHEKANILGYDNFAQLRNTTMSCPSYEKAIEFIRSLAIKGKPFALKELDALKSFAKSKGYDDIKSYDASFLANMMKKEQLHFDEEAYRIYFEKNQTIKGMFEFLHNLFGIDFKQVKGEKLWHDDATCYEILDNSGNAVAKLYIDLEARKEKRGGAWMNNWHTAHINTKGERVLPSAFIVANFPKSSENSPSLLRHDDVNTLFHEAGHAIHHLFSKMDELDVSGINGVEWDAVEFPSQFLENFSYEPVVLELFAKNYNTCELIPHELIDKLVENKNFQSGMFLVRQLEFALFDLLIHENAYTSKQVSEILNNVRKEVSVIMPPDYIMFENSFGHIFGGGYAAGYYSYKWAEMLSADAYLSFSQAGVFDDKLAKSLKEHVLEKGGSDNMDTLFEQFANRKPDENKLLELLGIEG